jgi:uncharacterized protein YndB with AHSA1/START domain/DNA-binding transcriptional ArsR family regulator
MDDVFAALAHPARRLLLDALRERDGRTLVELEAILPMTRFGVMKHLRVLEQAGLVASRRVGREKLHYLNPAPIRHVLDRWISAYAAPFVAAMSEMKTLAEKGALAMTDTAPAHVFELFVRAPAAQLWSILTDDAKTPLYQHFDLVSKTDWRVGGKVEFRMGDRRIITGEILELEAPRRLVMSFAAEWSPEVAADAPSKVTWEIEAVGAEACRLRLVHDGFAGATATSRAVGVGWIETISRLKTLAETGVPFRLPSA